MFTTQKCGMKEGLVDQRGKTAVLAADVCLHDDRTPAGEPGSRGPTYANDICCIVAPGYIDFGIDTHTCIWSQTFSSAENPDFMPASNLPPLNHQDIEFCHKMIAWRHTRESSSSAQSHHPNTSSGRTDLRNRWGPPLGMEASSRVYLYTREREFWDYNPTRL